MRGVDIGLRGSSRLLCSAAALLWLALAGPVAAALDLDAEFDYASKLIAMELPDYAIDLSGVELTHYRLKKQQEQRLHLEEGEGEYRLSGATELGAGVPHEPEKEALSQIIERLNELFAGDGLTDKDKLNYLNTIKDKVLENPAVSAQIENNAPDQVMLGDFPAAVEDAVMESLETHNGLAKAVLQNKGSSRAFARLLLDAILAEARSRQRDASHPQPVK